MATFRATFFRVSNRADTLQTMPVVAGSTAVRLDDLTTSGTSQVVEAGASAWAAPAAGFLHLHCDGAVNVAVGETPTASATAGFFMPAEVPSTVSVAEGEGIAVVDA